MQFILFMGALRRFCLRAPRLSLTAYIDILCLFQLFLVVLVPCRPFVREALRLQINALNYVVRNRTVNRSKNCAVSRISKLF